MIVALIILVVLFLLELFYFRIADKFNIVDKPNERSSHSQVVIRGGGIIVPIAVLIWWALHGYSYPFFILGLVMVSVISFLDDLFTLSSKLRLAIQLVAAVLLLYQAGFAVYSGWVWIPMLIVIVGWKNAFNFMDGVNGITALYTLSAVGAFFCVNQYVPFINNDLIIYTGLAVIVFSFFNLRKKARCFAGDIGSISIAFLLSFWMIRLIFSTGHVIYLLFFAVYGVDAILTIMHRIMKKENIFQPHRSHLYQYLANEMRIGHIPVSILYFILQAIIDLILILKMQTSAISNEPLWLILVILFLSVVYILVKYTILRKYKAYHRQED